MSETFKIINFHAENVKKLKVVDITPIDNTIVITGKNGAGKSSVLDSIYWALGGKENIQEKPIRNGQESAVIKLDLGKYIIERRFTEKDSYLHVTASDGAKYPSPQKMLDEMLSGITFDPLEFSRMKPSEQYNTLKGLVKLDIDIDAIEAKNKVDYDERTNINRKVKDLEAQTKDITFPEGLPDQPIDTAALMQDLNEKRKVREGIRDIAQRITYAEQNIALFNKQIEELNDRLEAERKKHKQAQDDYDAYQSRIPSDEALSLIEKEIASAGDINRKVHERTENQKKLDGLQSLRATADVLTKAIEERNARKEEAIAKADMPIAGLSFVDGSVYYEGVPFEQASSAQQLRVSTSIAMAMNPKLKVIRIKDGSLLDPEGMESLKEMVKQKGFQLWIETCYTDDQSAILIEDGAVKGAEPQEPADDKEDSIFVPKPKQEKFI